MVNFTYLIGSAAFLFGSLCGLHLWKNENYGLGMLSEVNVKSQKQGKFDAITKSQEQFGCGKSTPWSYFWLCVYVINACACILLLAIVFVFDTYHWINMINEFL
jgi:hypothetical protein